MTRDKERTKQKILDGLAGLLAEKGPKGVGINALAKAAGVDKVLIYRYFGGLPELVRVFAEQGGFWPSYEELAGKETGSLTREGIEAFAKSVLAGHLRELRKRPLTQEIMRWELLEKNELTDELARARENQTGRFLELFGLSGEEDRVRDMLAAATVIHAGLTYLVLRAKTAPVYMGVELDSERGWQRLERAARELVEAYFRAAEAGSEKDKEKKDGPKKHS